MKKLKNDERLNFLESDHFHSNYFPLRTEGARQAARTEILSVPKAIPARGKNAPDRRMFLISW